MIVLASYWRIYIHRLAYLPFVAKTELRLTKLNNLQLLVAASDTTTPLEDNK